MQSNEGINLFVTGTDTNVGKTVASAVLINYYKELNFLYFKPIQTGDSTDIALVNKLLSKSYSDKESNVYSLKAPMSPWQAALKENKKISLPKIIDKFENLKKKHKNILTEGAGGLMVPLSQKAMIIDLIKKLKSRVILIVNPGLGTINHSLLSLNLLKQKRIKTVGFIVNRYPAEPSSIEKENPKMVEQLGGIKFLGFIKESNEQKRLPEFFPAYDYKTMESLLFV